MTSTRLEAFSDAVIAIIMTIMVLELRAPHGTDWTALGTVMPAFLTYVLSFLFLGVYWNNHHHMLHATERINGRILWANLHLLFWLSLVPFATAWMGDSHAARWPTAVYGLVQLFAGVAYFVLQNTIVAHHGARSHLAEAIGGDTKGRLSMAAYFAAVPLAFIHPWISIALWVAVLLIWLVPDPRIESRLER